MLSDQERMLLTARVDGELTPRQCRQVRRLLAQSAEAREFLRRLEEDVARIRSLTPPALDHDLSASVVNAIHDRHLRPGRRRLAAANRAALRSRFALPAAAALFAAASLLLLLGMIGVAFFSLPDTQPTPAERPAERVAANVTAPPVPKGSRPVDRPERATAVTPPEHSPPPGEAQATRPPVEPQQPTPAVTPPPPAEEAPVVTAPAMELFRPERMEAVTLPVVLAFRSLDGDREQGKLLGELRKDTAFRIELPCRNATKAFDRVHAALRSRAVDVVIDQTALVRLRQPQWKTNYLFFAEDVMPEDLAGLLRDIGRLDQSGRPAEAQLADLVLTRLSAGHRKELADLLGIDPISAAPPSTGPLGTDPHKPLPQKTADQLAKSLSNRPGSESKSAAVAAAERQALALSFNPVRPRRGSLDVRRYLDARKPARPGTLQVLLVLRGT